MTTARSSLTSSVVNNKIYCIWWWNGSIFLNTNEEYDPSTNTWSTKTMHIGRSNLTSSVVNNKIYCIWWYSNTLSWHANEEYDPSTNTWSTKTDMPTARYS